MQGKLQIQIREISNDGITVTRRNKINLDKNDSYHSLLANIKDKFKHFLEQKYFVYLPQGIEITEENFKQILDHLLRTSKKPVKLNFQKLTDNQEWNLGEKIQEKRDQGGDLRDQPQEKVFAKNPKKEAPKIVLQGRACDKRLDLTQQDFPLLELLDIRKPTPKEQTTNFSNIKNNAVTAIVNKLRSN